MSDRVQITVDVTNQVYTYRGVILSITNDFIEIQDDKIGKVSISKSRIITMKELIE